MRVLICHEFFYLRGGAERYMFDLMDLLTSYGHDVTPFSTRAPENRPTPHADYFVSGVDFPALIKSPSITGVARAAPRFLYNREARNALERLIDAVEPDVMHVFGFAHYLSIAILDAARRRGVPVVQSLLDYRWLCPNTTFLVDGRICERCRGGRFYNAVFHRCKRKSLGASLLAALQAYAAAWAHAADKVTLFLCHSRYLLNKMVEYGHTPEKFRYAPHFLDVENYPALETSEPYFVYFGRLSHEKGLRTLLRAAEIAKVPVKVIGTGAEEAFLRRYAQDHALHMVEFLGPMWGAPLQEVVAKARGVVCPSEWYENSSLAIYESMAMGRPVIGADIGGIPELVQHEVTGVTFRPADAEDLAGKLRLLFEQPELARRWGTAARRVAEEKFAPAKHYADLMSVYQEARALSRGFA